MKKTLKINSHNGGKVNIIVEDRKTIFVPMTKHWLDEFETEELWPILKHMQIDPDKFSGKNTHKKLRDLILKKQK